MRVSIGSDDLYPIALALHEELKKMGFEVKAYGALESGRVEPWPDVAFSVAADVVEGRADFGILICYTGTGVSIAANKVKGVRAALCFDAESARGARLWNDANILVLSGRLTTPHVGKEILNAWLSVKEPDKSEIENIRKVIEWESKA
ncbi:MAG: RpiB/LacA/LacB family sugar-phosphate isomerase [Candidatus Bathyarchaeota archaeon]|nr:RpiB/LacA/LacB family sugar-phosphate isomerase [Candidatus Bathyarchaeota archaeon]